MRPSLSSQEDFGKVLKFPQDGVRRLELLALRYLQTYIVFVRQHGVRTARQLANATKLLLLSWGLPELYIDDIKATADKTLSQEQAHISAWQQQAVTTGPVDTIASDRQVALQLLASPVSQEPQGIADLEAFLFAASAQLPVSVQPFQLIKSADPDLADALYLSGDCRIRRAGTADTGNSPGLDTPRWIMKFSEVLEALDSANPDGLQMLLRWNSSEKEVSYVVSKSASVKGAARVNTVASACRLSLLFGEDKVMASRGLEQAWEDLQAKLAAGYPALFYGQIPYLLVYAAAGVHTQFGRLLPLGQVERVGRILNVALLADRILLCCILVNVCATPGFVGEACS
ncbi:TPA: hypothetical protein ACH3X1_008924 [Trebouxia sp. C0004]